MSDQIPSHVLDISLTYHDIQALNSAAAIAPFFARLGYNTNARTPQTPGNLGITAESTVSPIKRIDLLCKACTQAGSMPKPVAEALAAMSRRIQEIEAKRVLKNRSDRSRLAPESQPIQDAIDAVLFRCYGLSAEEGRYIEQRLEEVL